MRRLAAAIGAFGVVFSLSAGVAFAAPGPDAKRPVQAHAAAARPAAHRLVGHRPYAHRPAIRRPPVRVVQRTTIINRNNIRVVRPVVGGPGPGRWQVGGRFDGPRVAFSDWGRYHLRPPPPGYEWVQDGGELVLIGLATGLVADIYMMSGQ